jgi:hypothetical protein
VKKILMLAAAWLVGCSSDNGNGSVSNGGGTASKDLSGFNTQMYFSTELRGEFCNEEGCGTAWYRSGAPGTHSKYEGDGDIIFRVFSGKQEELVRAGKIQNGQVLLDMPENFPDEYYTLDDDREDLLPLADSRALIAITSDKSCEINLLNYDKNIGAILVYASKPVTVWGINFSEGLNVTYYSDKDEVLSSIKNKNELMWHAGCKTLDSSTEEFFNSFPYYNDAK